MAKALETRKPARYAASSGTSQKMENMK